MRLGVSGLRSGHARGREGIGRYIRCIEGRSCRICRCSKGQTEIDGVRGTEQQQTPADLGNDESKKTTPLDQSTTAPF